MNNALLVVTMW